MKRLKGRHVLLIFIGFFATIAVVNAVMIYAAVATFGGIDKQNAYKVGLAFGREIVEAGEQEARGWRVTASVDARSPETRIFVTVRDSQDRPLLGLDISARLGHPVSARLDQTVAFSERGGGDYIALTAPLRGIRDIDLQIMEHGQRMFRSKSRLTFAGS